MHKGTSSNTKEITGKQQQERRKQGKEEKSENK